MELPLNYLCIADLDTSPSWYISKNGNDSPNCGRHYKSACATFTGLWQHLVNGSSRGNNITVISDTDLMIENMHLHSPDGHFTFQNLPSDRINITIANTEIEETFLEFNGSSISVRIENSLIRSSAMEFYEFSQSDQPVVIRNCTFDEVTWTTNSTSSVLKSHSLLSFKDTNVQLYSCNFTGIRGYPESMLCSDGNVTMMSVVARATEGTFMINRECNVQIMHSDIIDNSGSSFISVHDGKLKMENSHFINNTSGDIGIVHLKESEARVINSTLTGNQGEYVGGIVLIESEAQFK